MQAFFPTKLPQERRKKKKKFEIEKKNLGREKNERRTQK
jgi:hypothetical protein